MTQNIVIHALTTSGETTWVAARQGLISVAALGAAYSLLRSLVVLWQYGWSEEGEE